MRRYTEQVLNDKRWVNANGIILQMQDIDEDYTRNILMLLYKNRYKMWLDCKYIDNIESSEDGDEFFRNVIRKSVLWKSLVKNLEGEDYPTNFINAKGRN